MASVFKFFVEKLGGVSANTYIGKYGELFYDPDIGTLLIANGVEAGGIPLIASNVLQTKDFGSVGLTSLFDPNWTGMTIVNNNEYDFVTNSAVTLPVGYTINIINGAGSMYINVADTGVMRIASTKALTTAISVAAFSSMSFTLLDSGDGDIYLVDGSEITDAA